ncbi:tumor necrosis factor ligand superfamily member 6-like [Lissotriton helveticus]
MAKPRELMTDVTQRIDPSQQRNPLPSMALPLNPRTLPMAYGLVPWEERNYSDTFAARSQMPTAPPFPIPTRSKKMACSYICHTLIFLLILLALMGAGLGLYKILQLQQNLVTLKQSTSDGHLIPALEKQLGDRNTEAMKKEEVAAHLRGTKDILSPQLQWQSSSFGAFTAGVQYKDGGLVIRKNGLYFVYSEVFFRGEGCKNKHLKHVVYKRTPRYPLDLVLMDSVMTSNCMISDTWSRNSYLGAVFQLTEDDKLYVNVSDVTVVMFDAEKTFFGLYKL